MVLVLPKPLSAASLLSLASSAADATAPNEGVPEEPAVLTEAAVTKAASPPDPRLNEEEGAVKGGSAGTAALLTAGRAPPNENGGAEPAPAHTRPAPGTVEAPPATAAVWTFREKLGDRPGESLTISVCTASE